MRDNIGVVRKSVAKRIGERSTMLQAGKNLVGYSKQNCSFDYVWGPFNNYEAFFGVLRFSMHHTIYFYFSYKKIVEIVYVIKPQPLGSIIKKGYI